MLFLAARQGRDYLGQQNYSFTNSLPIAFTHITNMFDPMNNCQSFLLNSSMMDFAPLYGGVIFAIANTVAGMSGFLAPLITGALLGEDEESSTIQQWQMAFLVTALASVPGLIMFQIFGSDQIQDWALVCPMKPKLFTLEDTHKYLLEVWRSSKRRDPFPKSRPLNK